MSGQQIPAGAIPAALYRRQQAKLREPKPDYAGMLAQQCAGAMLPSPVFEHLYARPERAFRADLAWLGRERLLVEVQGGIYTRQAHGSISGVLADNDRLNEATLHGWRLLRVIPEEVEDGTALGLIERALGGMP